MKKLLIALLSITLTAVLFAGCGKSEDVIPESESMQEETTILDMGSISTGRPALSINGSEISGDIPGGLYSVVIHSFNEGQKMDLIKFLREHLALSLADAKAFTESLPSSITNLSEDKATELAEEFLAFDCEVDILDAEGNVIYNSLYSMIADTQTYDIIIKNIGTCSSVQLIKYLRERLNLGLREAKNFSETLPQTLYSDISGIEVKAIVDELTGMGLKIELVEK